MNGFRILLSVCGLILLGARQARPSDDSFAPSDRQHWAFQKIQRPDPPRIPSPDNQWVRNPIDAFILAELTAKGLRPAPPADKITLLRRASFDLIGLPPSEEDLDAYLNDHSGKAFNRAIERLLASPHYGERWARHWLDLARYAESEGFKADETRPNAWRYRDYVIQSFNIDKPYDRFIHEQIAGDEIWPADPNALIATAFNRHYPDESNARNLMQRRQEILNDITDTAGAVFTGLTIGCARCHNHKFDPILQKDYYRLQAFFANTTAADTIALAPVDQLKDFQAKLTAWEEQTRVIRDQIQAIEKPYRESIIKDYVDKYPEEIQAALIKPEAERTPFEWAMVAKARLYLDPKSHQYIASSDDVKGRIKGEDKKRWDELQVELKQFEPLHPGQVPIGTGVTDINAEAPKTYLLKRGLYDAPREEVEAGFLTILDPNPTPIIALKMVNSTGRRTALANLLTDPENPLTPRVFVNRLWYYHFGNGIVRTPSDFGLKGDRPSHPALLDWLAIEFIRNGWSIKQMHWLIMTSSTYQQSSAYSQEAAKLDPENRLLWRFPRQRLEGEVIRDTSLAVADLLNRKMGGPSIFPELPPGMHTRGGWKISSDPNECNRRSIYVFVRRNTRYPLFESFDMPDTHESCARRNITTTPLQALNLLNSEMTLQWARGFAGRVIKTAGPDDNARIEAAFRFAYSRPPKPREKQIVTDFFERHRAIVGKRLAAGEPVALPLAEPDQLDPAQGAALVDLCHMLMNSNEFVYRN